MTQKISQNNPSLQQNDTNKSQGDADISTDRGSFILTPEDEKFIKDIYPKLRDTILPHFVGKKGSPPSTALAELSGKVEQILLSNQTSRNWSSETKDPVMVKHVLIMMLQKDFTNKQNKKAQKNIILKKLAQLASTVDYDDKTLANYIDSIIKDMI